MITDLDFTPDKDVFENVTRTESLIDGTLIQIERGVRVCLEAR